LLNACAAGSSTRPALLDALPISAHRVVQAAAGQDDLGVVADGLRLVRQVVRVDADAVAAHQAGAERQEVPLGAGGLQHRFGIDRSEEHTSELQSPEKLVCRLLLE